MRYSQISRLLDEHRPSSCLEVGTWNGERAIEMLQYGIYYGFDLFEDATPETDTEEFNVKPHFSVSHVGKKLQAFGRNDFFLYKGNTRETLTKFANEFPEKIDFFWIDGGHSVETIKMDWENVQKIAKKDSVILFDDYYSGMSDEALEKIGCNRILEPLDFDLLPHKDWVKGGGQVQMARVYL